MMVRPHHFIIQSPTQGVFCGWHDTDKPWFRALIPMTHDDVQRFMDLDKARKEIDKLRKLPRGRQCFIQRME